jgi:multidrug efflux pump subunit AcrA (membrane-fusion protein)
MKKLLKRLLVTIVILAGVGAGVWFLWFRNTEAAPQYVQAAVTRGEVVTTVSGSGTIRTPYTVGIRAARGGLVTALSIKEGQLLEPGEELFRVDDHPVYALGGRFPFYRALGTGEEEGEDVRSLQQMLKGLGFYAGDVDGAYNDDTMEAVRDFLENRGQERTAQVGPDFFQAIGDGTMAAAVSVSVGDLVQQGMIVATAMPVGSLEAVVDINEIDFPRVGVGQAVRLTLGALPGKRFAGTVIRVSSGLVPAGGAGVAAAGSSAYAGVGVVSFPVTVSIDSPGSDMKAGMSVDVSIVLEKAVNVLAIPASAVQVTDGKDYVLLPASPAAAGEKNPQPQQAEVTVGLRADDLVEIRSGLSEGQVIIVGLDVTTISLPTNGLFGGRPESARSGQGLGR